MDYDDLELFIAVTRVKLSSRNDLTKILIQHCVDGRCKREATKAEFSSVDQKLRPSTYKRTFPMLENGYRCFKEFTAAYYQQLNAGPLQK